jgi:hypothetical protein
MAENPDVLICPLCKGHGEVLRSEVAEEIATGDLKSRIAACLTVAESELTGEVAAVSAANSRDFQKDVHGWNPQLPMWRRSPKE